MKKFIHLGPILLLVAALLALGEILYFTIDHTAIYRWADANRIVLASLAGVLLALAFWVYPKRESIEKEVESLIVREQLAPVSQAGADVLRNQSGIGSARVDRDALASTLRSEGGIGWRYRRPFFLLVGAAPTIDRFLPDLVGRNWLVSDDAVLLSSKSGSDGRPDEHWLRQIYAFRRRRPIDAVVLVLDEIDNLSPQRRGTNALDVNLSRIADLLHWSAPVYVLDVAKTDAFNNGRTAVLGCEFAPDANERAVESTLLELRSRIGHISIGQLIRNGKDRYSAQLSQRLDSRSAPLAALIASLANRKARHQSVSAAFFAPFPLDVDAGAVADPTALTAADLPLWNHLATIARKQRGTRMGWHPVTVFSTIALSVIGIWTAGMLISGMTNGLSLSEVRQTIQTLKTAPDPAAHLQASLTLQQQIGRYEDRVAHQPPVWSRFGLNQDKAILAALWPP
ncbi:MAG: type VI secretion protein VasK, partial [Caballeronia sp.]